MIFSPDMRNNTRPQISIRIAIPINNSFFNIHLLYAFSGDNSISWDELSIFCASLLTYYNSLGVNQKKEILYFFMNHKKGYFKHCACHFLYRGKADIRDADMFREVKFFDKHRNHACVCLEIPFVTSEVVKRALNMPKELTTQDLHFGI